MLPILRWTSLEATATKLIDLSLRRGHEQIGSRIDRQAGTQPLSELGFPQKLAQLCFQPLEKLRHPLMEFA